MLMAKDPQVAAEFSRRMTMMHDQKILRIVLVALLFFSLAEFGFAQPNQTYETKDVRNPMDARPPEGIVICQMAGIPPGVPIEVFHSGRGFALKGNESHILRLNVEMLLPLEPMHIRKLLASNKSIEEIRKEIKAKDGNATYRGSVRLDKSTYPLHNINVASSGANTTIMDADMAEPTFGPAKSNETAIVGHIAVTTSPNDGGWIGKGLLTIHDGQYRGEYAVLLDMLPPPCEGRGMIGPRK